MIYSVIILLLREKMAAVRKYFFQEKSRLRHLLEYGENTPTPPWGEWGMSIKILITLRGKSPLSLIIT
jgi:hypothetical protein